MRTLFGWLGFVLVVLILVFVVAFLAYRGSGKEAQENRTVQGIRTVVLRDVGELSIEQGKEESLVVIGEDNIISRLDTKVADGVLTIGFRFPWRGLLTPTRPVRFQLVVTDLEAIEVQGSATFSTGYLKLPSLAVTLEGEGRGTLRTTVDRFTVHANEQSSLVVSGSTDTQEGTVRGAGRYDARDFTSSTANVTVADASRATVRVTGSLDATVSGSGSLQYLGNPTVQEHISGNGSCTKVNEPIY